MDQRDMNCEEVLAHLLAYLDREADAQAAADIERHLQGCRGCFSRAEFERELKARLSDAAAEPAPQTLRARIKALVERY